MRSRCRSHRRSAAVRRRRARGRAAYGGCAARGSGCAIRAPASSGNARRPGRTARRSDATPGSSAGPRARRPPRRTGDDTHRSLRGCGNRDRRRSSAAGRARDTRRARARRASHRAAARERSEWCRADACGGSKADDRTGCQVDCQFCHDTARSGSPHGQQRAPSRGRSSRSHRKVEPNQLPATSSCTTLPIGTLLDHEIPDCRCRTRSRTFP